VARILSSYLTTKYQSLPLDGTLNPPNEPELINLLTSLKANKAAGHDDLSPSVLKADPQGLVRVINYQLIVPQDMGVAKRQQQLCGTS
jgi:hypothetical protein